MKITKAILIPILLLTVVLVGCKKDMKEVLFEDVYFNMNLSEFLKNQVHVQFVNANYEKSSVVPDVKITIGGKNSDVVYDINGTRDIKIENQLSMIAVSPGKDIPASSPLSFTLHAEAAGFMPMEKEITVKDVDDYTNLVFEMIEIANPPVGVKAQQVGNFNVVNYDATNSAILSNMGGYIPNFSNKAIKAGIAVDYYFQPISYFTVDQQAGSTASQPQTQEFLLPANAVNSTTGETISQNDVIEVYRKNSQEDTWQYVSDVKVQTGNASSLKIALQLAGPGEIALSTSPSAISSTCSSTLGLYFNRPTNVNTLHYIEVVRNDNPKTVLISAQNVQIAQGLIYDFTTKLPSNIDVIVNVYEFETSSEKGRIVATSGKISSCKFTTSSRLSLTVNPPKVTNNPVVRFELDTYCATSKTVYYHEGRTQYRISGSTGPYKDFGLAIKANSTRSQTVSALPGQPGYVNTTGYSFLESDRILWDWNYEFLTIVSGPNKQTGKTVTKTYTRVKKFLPSNYTATVAPGNTVYPGGYFKFYKEYWFAPSSACSDFGY
jgi:hypothetical protein